jgi:hypothetical protein
MLFSILGVLSGLVYAAPPTSPPFSGTTWISTNDGGVNSSLHFNADGTWVEQWGNATQHVGYWDAAADGTEVSVTCNDARVFQYKLNEHNLLIRQNFGPRVYKLESKSDAAAAASTINWTKTTPAPGPAPVTPAVPAKPATPLTTDEARAIVLIKGDHGEGTGFLVKMPDGPAIVTNLHVLSDNPNLVITSSTGAPITIVSYKGATDRDLAMISIKDGNFSYLTLATDVLSTVQAGDEVLTPGNSEGGEVMLTTDGKVLAVGPQRVEFDNPIYHGNSGGPVIHVKSGKVIGVVTMGMKVDIANELDHSSFVNANSAIVKSMRYFGLRLDTVPQWELLNRTRYLAETALLEAFEKRSESMISFLMDGPMSKGSNKNRADMMPVFLGDEPLVKAYAAYSQQAAAAGKDKDKKMKAAEELVHTLTGLADIDLPAIQKQHFYAFDQLRADEDITEREAVKKGLSMIDASIQIAPNPN